MEDGRHFENRNIVTSYIVYLTSLAFNLSLHCQSTATVIVRIILRNK